MLSEKMVYLIETVQNMPEWEVAMLEIFLAGFRAGKRLAGREKPVSAPSGAGSAELAKR